VLVLADIVGVIPGPDPKEPTQLGASRLETPGRTSESQLVCRTPQPRIHKGPNLSGMYFATLNVIDTCHFAVRDDVILHS
jgi:hypothetical protein